MLDVLFVAVAVGLVSIAITVWGTALRRGMRAEPLLPREPHSAVRWGLLDVLIAIGLLFLCAIVATQSVDQRFGVTPESAGDDLPLAYYRWKVTGLGVASLVTLLISAGSMWIRYRFSWRDLGLDGKTLWHDLRLGVSAFFLLAPPVYFMQFMLVSLFKFESKHPIVELLRENPDSWLILASVGSAVLVAPVFEEFLFRGLLQGWLEKLVSFSGPPAELFLGEGRGGPAATKEHQATQSTDTNPSQTPRVAAPPLGSAAADEDSGMPLYVARYMPIFASSLLFAVMHLSHGPDWLPLFVLAAGLGYLYQQTHRLLPCIVVHFLLNLCSMSMFLFELLRN